MNDASTGALLALLIFLIFLSAFFSSSETAMLSVNRFRLKHLKKKIRGAKRTSDLLERPDRLIGLILIGNNAVNILAALISGILFARWFGPEAGIWLTTALLTLIMLVFAEVTPKTLAALHPERLAFPYSIILSVLLHPFSPVFWLVIIVNWITNSIVRAFGVDPTSLNQEEISPDELRTVVDEAGQLIPDQHQDMLINILDLEKMTVDDIMVPRNEIIGLDLEDDIEDLTSAILKSDHTRLPVYQGDINKIIGTLHLRRVNRMMKAGGEQITKEAIKRFCRKPYFIPENTSLPVQLVNFQKNKHRMGFIVNEYGEVEGLATLDDLLEEIVGDYTTSVADEEQEVEQLSEKEYQILGSTNLRDLNKITHWNIPTDGPKTLSGFLVEELEVIPDGPVSYQHDNLRFETLEISEKLIEKCRAWRFKSAAPVEED
ncbi:MAG: HlyC/CorC family transporter [Porticoccaceae bacterium]|nr:HlyC/CorC family transporter [Porticoccaceae bacterium]